MFFIDLQNEDKLPNQLSHHCYPCAMKYQAYTTDVVKEKPPKIGSPSAKTHFSLQEAMIPQTLRDTKKTARALYLTFAFVDSFEAGALCPPVKPPPYPSRPFPRLHLPVRTHRSP